MFAPSFARDKGSVCICCLAENPKTKEVNKPPARKKRANGDEGSEDEDGVPEVRDRSVKWTECPSCKEWIHDQCHVHAKNGLFCGYCKKPITLFNKNEDESIQK